MTPPLKPASVMATSILPESSPLGSFLISSVALDPPGMSTVAEPERSSPSASRLMLPVPWRNPPTVNWSPCAETWMAPPSNELTGSGGNTNSVRPSQPSASALAFTASKSFLSLLE